MRIGRPSTFTTFFLLCRGIKDAYSAQGGFQTVFEPTTRSCLLYFCSQKSSATSPYRRKRQFFEKSPSALVALVQRPRLWAKEAKTRGKRPRKEQRQELTLSALISNCWVGQLRSRSQGSPSRTRRYWTHGFRELLQCWFDVEVVNRKEVTSFAILPYVGWILLGCCQCCYIFATSFGPGVAAVA